MVYPRVCIVFYSLQNDQKMGDTLTSVFYMILLSVCVVCKSLPSVKHDDDSMDKTVRRYDDNSMDKTIKRYKYEIGPYLADKAKSTVDMGGSYINNDISERNSLISQNLTKISLFKNIDYLKKKLLTRSTFSRSENKFLEKNKNAFKTNVIRPRNIRTLEPKINNHEYIGERNYRKRDPNFAKPKQTFTKALISDTSQPDSDQIVPVHRKSRQRRSYLHDYGLALSYSDDEKDIVFGAHTSPCAHRDRHYCLNGGTCFFVGALEIKTCQ